MKVALCQMNITWENKEENYEKAMYFIKDAADREADVILFPEMSFTGFSMNTDNTKEKNFETKRFLQKISRENRISLGFGWVKANHVLSENHYTILDNNGNEILDYIKIHPFRYAGEHVKFLPGTQIKTCFIDDFKISTFLCYDLRFPEIFQAISSQVSAIIVPANWPTSRADHWMCLLKARAIENQVYMIGVNCVGEINGIQYSGDSLIVNPIGEVVNQLSDHEGLLIHELKNDVCHYQKNFPVKLDRNVELYKRIL